MTRQVAIAHKKPPHLICEGKILGSPRRRFTSASDLDKPGGYRGLGFKFPGAMPGILPPKQLGSQLRKA